MHSYFLILFLVLNLLWLCKCISVCILIHHVGKIPYYFPVIDNLLFSSFLSCIKDIINNDYTFTHNLLHCPPDAYLLWNCHYAFLLCHIIVLQDIELSKEINDSFRQSSQARTKLPTGIEMSVHVLTTGWVFSSWNVGYMLWFALYLFFML